MPNEHTTDVFLGACKNSMTEIFAKIRLCTTLTGLKINSHEVMMVI